MFGNLFKHEPVVLQDDTEYIYLTDDGSFNFPLTCEDDLLYATCLNDMRGIFIKWVAVDRQLAAETGLRVEGTVSYLLNTIDLKFLAHPSQLERLLEILESDNMTRSGSRFFDAIMSIYAVIPTRIIECFKGKFLYGVIYGLPKVIDGNELPTKEMWVELLKEVPYAPFLLLLQEVLTDEMSGIDPFASTVQPVAVNNAPTTS